VITSNKAFIRAGAALLLLKPRSKVPVGEDWSEAPVATFDELQRRCKGHNVGVRLGKWSKIGGFFLHVIDVDIRSTKHETEAREKLAGILMGYDFMGFPRVKSGSGGASFHLYFVTDKPFKSKKLAHSEGFSHVFDHSKGREVKKWDWEIELFGTGKQVAIPPSIHPETGNEYSWEVEFDPTADYPLVESTDIEAELREPEAEIGTDDQTGISYEDAEEFLKGLDPDYWCEDREGWIKVGMALHHEFDGEKDAFDVWCDFARQSSKFDLREHKAQWRSFKNRGARPTTFRTVIEAANEGQWAATYDQLPNMFDDIEEVTTGGDISDEFDDLPPRVVATKSAEKAEEKRKEIVRRRGDPDMSILDYTNQPAPRLPLDILSSRLQKIVRDSAINAGAPEDFVFASLITSASMCMGNSVRVKIKEGFEQPAIIWAQIIGGPSTNKSPAMRIPLKCLTAIQDRMMVPFREAIKKWEQEKKLADQFLKDWETKQKAMIASGQEVSAEPPSNAIAPPKPAEPILVMNDASIEAFYRRQAITPRGFGVSRDELAAFMADMERYGNSSNRAAWLESYEGSSHTIERVKDEGKIIHIPHCWFPRGSEPVRRIISIEN
jgi:hypothetical protein